MLALTLLSLKQGTQALTETSLFVCVCVAKQMVSVGLMTPNLHDLACQLHLQELSMGNTIALLELWVEGLIQTAKGKVKGKTTKHIEEVMVNNILVSNALCLNKFSHGEPMQTLEEMKAAEAAEKEDDTQDDDRIDPAKGCPETSAFLDSGVPLTADDEHFEECMEIILRSFNLNEGEDRALHEMDLAWMQRSGATIWLHKQAVVGGAFVLNCREYHLQQSRESFWILANYTSQLLPGSVEFYARVELSPAADGSSRFLRVAMCRFWKPLAPYVDLDLGDHPTYRFMLDSVERDARKQVRLYALPMESIEAPMIHTHHKVISKKKPGVIRKMYLFARYSHLSGLKREGKRV